MMLFPAAVTNSPNSKVRLKGEAAIVITFDVEFCFVVQELDVTFDVFSLYPKTIYNC